MGKVGFGELAFWLVTRRRPTPAQVRVFESVLVALADHGFTPTAIAARLTYLSAPDSLQGAMAAGLLGGGSRFLGVTEDCGPFLADVLARHTDDVPADVTDDAGWEPLALTAVREARAAGRYVPGLGHPVHKERDPRTPRLMRIAEEEGLKGPHLRLFEAIGRVHPEVLGRPLPLNGAGVCGAALADLGLPVELLRGFALLARAAGLLGQLAEETRRPDRHGRLPVGRPQRRGTSIPRRSQTLERDHGGDRRGHRLDASPVLLPGQHRHRRRPAARSPTSGWRKIERFRETLTRARPDVLVMVGSDHFHQLWLDNMPQFLVGKAPFYDANWYNEEREFGLPRMRLRGPRGPLRRTSCATAWTPASTSRSATSCASTTASPARSSRCDRRPTCRSCRSTPTSSPRRCRSRSGSSSSARRSGGWSSRGPRDQRVAIIGTGHLSLELGGPRQFGPHGPDPEFDARRWSGSRPATSTAACPR